MVSILSGPEAPSFFRLYYDKNHPITLLVKQHTSGHYKLDINKNLHHLLWPSSISLITTIVSDAHRWCKGWGAALKGSSCAPPCSASECGIWVPVDVYFGLWQIHHIGAVVNLTVGIYYGPLGIGGNFTLEGKAVQNPCEYGWESAIATCRFHIALLSCLPYIPIS